MGSGEDASKGWLQMSAPRWMFLLLLIGLSLPLIIGQYYTHLMVNVFILAIFAYSQDLIIGHTGYLSLAGAAFYSVGAYTSAMASTMLGYPVLATILLGCLLALIVGVLVGGISFWRTESHYFILISIAFAEIFHVLYRGLTVTGGPGGIAGIPVPSIVFPGVEITLVRPSEYYYLALIAMVISVLVMTALVRSDVGRILHGIRENEMLIESMGTDTYRYKLLAFAVGAFFAGLAGALHAHYNTVITPFVGSFVVTLEALIVIAVGGMGTRTGPLVGALLFVFATELLRITDEFRLILFGTLLVVIVIYYPDGLVSFVRARLIPAIRARS